MPPYGALKLLDNMIQVLLIERAICVKYAISGFKLGKQAAQDTGEQGVEQGHRQTQHH